MAAHGQLLLPQGFHLISLLRRQLLLKEKPLAAHGQRVLNLGDALALPLGELLNEVKLRGRGTRPAGAESGRCVDGERQKNYFPGLPCKK